MRLKSYFAGTVESAIALARQELGEDAMLVSSHRTLPESRHLGAYEVVFASHEVPRHTPAPIVAAPAKVEGASAPSALANEVAEMRRQLARVSSLVSRSALRSGRRSSSASNPQLDLLDEILVTQDVDPDLACSILRNLEALGPAASAADLSQAFRKEIQNRLTASPELSPWSFETAAGPGATSARIIAALVGPP